MPSRFTAIVIALGAAALFGAATPVAKILLGGVPPFMVAGLFYLGSGIGLGGVILLRSGANHSNGLRAGELPWLAEAIVAGGVAGPALLMLGLTSTPASTSALLLNLEGVLTAAIAWLVFRENVDRQVFLGMAAIVAGGVVLAWQPDATSGSGLPGGTLLIVLACACWAIDNNLTRKISAADATLIACAKGLVAGVTNLCIAFALGARLPAPAPLFAAMATGFAGYGVSLVMFVIALRHLGTARTGAYFSVAPVFGVAISLAIWPHAPGALFWIAAVLMAFGVWLHVRERHEHEHTHEPLAHTHRHTHDAHHRHEHDLPYDGDEPHTHPHAHLPITHTHAHFPDVHHRHAHG
ncbi:DMT family transporter [Caballeronia sp. LZ032]|uniref:DMT family transporter n=1 Tax=Caballeronia sp. LZ032 TaxID=3038565 RepID=UPI002858535E|nr:DMT family transporter [Caballeronia sp. LZ032]MDR5880915.1 DMT family transporter [Caballeronia sp. LZ032]